MPQGDKTGPNGEGPMTGRGMGYCSGYDNPGYASDEPRKGSEKRPRNRRRRNFQNRRKTEQ